MSKEIAFNKLVVTIEGLEGGQLLTVDAFLDETTCARTRSLIPGNPGEPRTNRRVRKAMKAAVEAAFPVPKKAPQKDVPGQTLLAGTN